MSMIINPYAFGAAPSAFYANATEYDGTTAYLFKTSAVYGSSSSVGSAVVWVRLDTNTAAADSYAIWYGFDEPLVGFVIGLSINPSTSELQFLGYDSGDFDPVLAASSTSLGSLPTGWLCLMVSWDLNAAAGARSVQMYSGDTSVFGSFSTDIGSAFAIPYASLPNWFVGGDTAGDADLNGGMAELWVDFTTKIDFSNVTNRRKFFSATGKPVDLGADGSTPLGTAPAIYLKSPAATVEVNSGTGGNFTRNGTLTAAATSPSD